MLIYLFLSLGYAMIISPETNLQIPSNLEKILSQRMHRNNRFFVGVNPPNITAECQVDVSVLFSNETLVYDQRALYESADDKAKDLLVQCEESIKNTHICAPTFDWSSAEDQAAIAKVEADAQAILPNAKHCFVDALFVFNPPVLVRVSKYFPITVVPGCNAIDRWEILQAMEDSIKESLQDQIEARITLEFNDLKCYL